MVEEEPNGSSMDTWLDSPYIYDIYDTNDGDSMKFMTQFIYEGSHIEIYDMLGLNRESYRVLMGFGEGKEAPTRIWEKSEGKERCHMA